MEHTEINAHIKQWMHNTKYNYFLPAICKHQIICNDISGLCINIFHELYRTHAFKVRRGTVKIVTKIRNFHKKNPRFFGNLFL